MSKAPRTPLLGAVVEFLAVVFVIFLAYFVFHAPKYVYLFFGWMLYMAYGHITEAYDDYKANGPPWSREEE